MWLPLKDCGKQLNTDFRVRQTLTDDHDEFVTEYAIKEVEYDQYELQLVNKTKNGSPALADTSEVLVFSCTQLIDYKFEVWTEVSS